MPPEAEPGPAFQGFDAQKFFPNSRLTPAANPAELASSIRTFLADTGSKSLEYQCLAADRLHAIACASAADARTIVSAEGVLRRVGRNLAAMSGGAIELHLAKISISAVGGAVDELDSAVLMRVAEETDLLRALVQFVARAPRAALVLARGYREWVANIRTCSAVILTVSSNAAAAPACVRVVDALSDADLQALVQGSFDREVSQMFSSAAVPFLGVCLGHAPLLRRLVGPAGLPLALVAVVTGEGSSERSRSEASRVFIRLLEASHKHGLPFAAWAKPLVKTLRATFKREARSVAPGALLNEVSQFLITLSLEDQMIPAVAAGLPDYIASLLKSGSAAINAATILCNLSAHPGALAAAFREGAVPVLSSLLYEKDGKAGAALKALCKDKDVAKVVASKAFIVLGNFLPLADARAAILATDAPLRMRGTLMGASTRYDLRRPVASGQRRRRDKPRRAFSVREPRGPPSGGLHRHGRARPRGGAHAPQRPGALGPLLQGPRHRARGGQQRRSAARRRRPPARFERRVQPGGHLQGRRQGWSPSRKGGRPIGRSWMWVDG